MESHSFKLLLWNVIMTLVDLCTFIELFGQLNFFKLCSFLRPWNLSFGVNERYWLITNSLIQPVFLQESKVPMCHWCRECLTCYQGGLKKQVRLHKAIEDEEDLDPQVSALINYSHQKAGKNYWVEFIFAIWFPPCFRSIITQGSYCYVKQERERALGTTDPFRFY